MGKEKSVPLTTLKIDIILPKELSLSQYGIEDVTYDLCRKPSEVNQGNITNDRNSPDYIKRIYGMEELNAEREKREASDIYNNPLMQARYNNER